MIISLLRRNQLEGHVKKGVVNESLEEYILRRKQIKDVEGFGNIDYDPDYDIKKQGRVSERPC
jgi:hypothetical protein